MQTTETIDAARRRLAEKARAEGVKLYVDRRDQRHYAASTTRPGDLYYVTLLSCSCRGFIAHQRCKHHAALLSAYGQIGPDPGSPGCANCGGHDAPHADTRSRWVGGSRDGYADTATIHRCTSCHLRERAVVDRIAA